MNYKNAFKCHKCPQRNDELGCPAWVEYVETNVASGEERITRDCLYQSLPKMLIEVIKASNRPAAAIESTRNQITAGLKEIANKIQVPRQPVHYIEHDD
jgi:hypothetical protein